MYNFAKFTLRDMTALGTALRNLGAEAETMEGAANHIVRHLYDNFIDPSSNEPACALVRFYKTHAYSDLEAGLARFAAGLLSDQPYSPSMKCLTLLATAGQQPEWNTRQASSGHKAIPLPSEEVVLQLPMVAQLVQQFGLEISAVLQSAPEIIVAAEQDNFNVFHVPDALGSPYVPAQEGFVIPFGIKSVLGFGGMLPDGNLFAVILFAKIPIDEVTADMFKVLALNTKVAILPFAEDAIFRTIN